MTQKNPEHDKIQGEGDKEAARRYTESAHEFVESGKVPEAAERASDQDPQEAEQAEHTGRQRSKEQDPAVHRDYQRPTKD